MNNLQIGDLVWFKNYFWVIESIAVNQDSRFDELHMRRKYRPDGSFIKSNTTTWVYKAWVHPPDIFFQRKIDDYKSLIDIYNKIK